MISSKFSGSAQITDEGIKKHFKSYEPIQAIYELVWNGLDANATEVCIDLIHNQIGGLDNVTVVDNGDGIDVKNIQYNFGRFNESSNRYDDDKHGSNGRGRLSFHILSNKAIWYTKRDDYNVAITVYRGDVKNFNGIYLDKKDSNQKLNNVKTGTCVELIGFDNRNLPEEKIFLNKLSQEFGWYLALNGKRKILLNGNSIPIPSHEIFETTVNIEHNEFAVKVIRWDVKPTSEKSYN
jgi:hypothetical protein